MVNAQAYQLFVVSFMRHAVTARRIVSFFSVQKKYPETLAQQKSPGCPVYLPSLCGIQINVTDWFLAPREEDKALFILGQ